MVRKPLHILLMWHELLDADPLVRPNDPASE
jgi:hypothetical protein